MGHLEGSVACYGILVAMGMLFLQGVDGRSIEGSEVHGETVAISILAGVVGLVCLAAVVMICAEAKVNPNVKKTGPPEWTRSLYFKNEMNAGFQDYSEGIHTPTPQHVIRERLGRAVTDAARWTCPITEGKHVFEVYWPKEKNRGHSCCIGLGTDKLKLSKPGKCSLVGEHSESWGLDLARQQSIHYQTRQQRLYNGVPDRFVVYVDKDSGKIGFGGDVYMDRERTEFFGYVCHGIPKNLTMYLMISMAAPNEHVHVHYRGTYTPQGGFNLLDVPSPLQFTSDNLGNVHLIPPQNQAPPTYAAAFPDGKPPPVMLPHGQQDQKQHDGSMGGPPPPPVY